MREKQKKMRRITTGIKSKPEEKSPIWRPRRI